MTWARGLPGRMGPWVQAARPIAHPMIFLPLLIGQLFAFDRHQQFSLTFFLYALLFGLLYQAYLLYLNDYADEAVDRTNDHYFLSGGSRVLPDGKLQAKHLLAGARVVLVILAALGAWLAIGAERPWFLIGLGLAVVLCWAYNAKPLQLSYRGHGEVLQGLGCGVLLPLIGFYLQQGSLQAFPWLALAPLYLLFHAGNIVTALPDYASDKVGGKHTVPVRIGEQRARKAALLLLLMAYGLVVAVNLALPPVALAIIVVPSLLILVGIVLSGLIIRADSANFGACKRFVSWVSLSQAWVLLAWVGVLLLGGAL
ncbi:MAG: prenyltransferase [Pseudomonadota bacterium]